jgi:hypothetical protein
MSYLFYINILYILEELPILFARYTGISLKAGNEEGLQWSLETVALNVNSWFHANQLIPNCWASTP